MEETHEDKILKALPDPKNRTEILIKLFHQSRLKNDRKVKDELMCKKCLTPWASGQFMIKMKSSNHRRKNRRKFRIERLQKEQKEMKGTKCGEGKRRKLIRLQQQSNHAAIYKCFCSATTQVQLWKKMKGNDDDRGKQEAEKNYSRKDKFTSTTAAKAKSVNQSAKKPKMRKKNKTAGSIILHPPTTVPSSSSSLKRSTAQKSASLNLSKLSQIFQQQKQQEQNAAPTPQSKLNQFFK